MKSNLNTTQDQLINEYIEDRLIPVLDYLWKLNKTLIQKQQLLKILTACYEQDNFTFLKTVCDHFKLTQPSMTDAKNPVDLFCKYIAGKDKEEKHTPGLFGGDNNIKIMKCLLSINLTLNQSSFDALKTNFLMKSIACDERLSTPKLEPKKWQWMLRDQISELLKNAILTWIESKKIDLEGLSKSCTNPLS